MNVFKKIWHWFERMSSPRTFYQTTGRWIPWLIISTVGLMLWGAINGLVYAPTHAQQGEVYRIIYIHVPAASLSLMVYLAMAVSAAVSLIWRLKMAEVITTSCAPIGAAFTLIALFTGSLWGATTWNTFWVWDARMTSELFLLFLYMGVIGLGNAIEDRRSSAQATAILILSAVVIIPFIMISVEPSMGFNTLHQGSTEMLNKNEMAASIRTPLLIMFFGYLLYFVLAVILRARNEILFRERNTKWVRQELGL